METLAANYRASKARRETMHGREYVVAPLTLIVPGVLNGSNGPLYYPADEVSKDPAVWNGVPLVAYHPEAGKSGRDPEVFGRDGLGHVYRTRFVNGKLRAEGWFDVEAVRNRDKTLPPDARILPRLEAGRPIELSTGLFTRNEPAPDGSTFNGRSYVAVARNYKPDHLAVLPDQAGACSLKDGCGVHNAGRKPNPDCCDECKAGRPCSGGTPSTENAVNKTELVSWLTTNCACWKGDADTLNKLDEAKLKTLKAAAEKAAETEAVANAAAAGFKTLFGDDVPALNAMPAFIKKKMDAKKGKKAEDDEDMEDDEETENGKDKTKKTYNGSDKQMTAKQWLETAPPEIQAAVKNAARIERRERAALVDRIVKNSAATKDAQDALRPVYQDMPLETLETVAANLKPVKAENARKPFPPLDDEDDDFGGADFSGNGFVGNRRKAADVSGEDDDFGLPADYLADEYAYNGKAKAK